MSKTFRLLRATVSTNTCIRGLAARRGMSGALAALPERAAGRPLSKKISLGSQVYVLWP